MKSVITSPSLSAVQTTDILAALNILSEKGELIYKRKGQTLYRFQASGMELVAKEYHLRTFSRKFAAFFRFSRARRSYRAGWSFLNHEIATPRPILLVEYSRITPLRSILVTEFLPGKSLRQILSEREAPSPELPRKLLHLLHQLQNAHLRHGDLHAANIFPTDEGDPVLIDLDGVRPRFNRRTIRRNVIEDRNRLLGSVDFNEGYYKTLTQVLGSPEEPLPAL
jgi:tRNA A-37 threonylcarbamoyl transferase component Bud32